MIINTRSVADIKSIICDPKIWAVTSGAGTDPKLWNPSPEASYLLLKVDDKNAGLTVYHKFMDGLKCHFYVLEEFRIKYARDFAKDCLDIALGQYSNIYAEIKQKHKTTRNFAKKMGFVEVKDNLMRLEV